MSSKEFDVQQLLTAIDNDNNEPIMKYTREKICAMKNDVLQQLQLSRTQIKIFHKKLKQYRYINDLTDIQFGSYIRWIPLKDPQNIRLTNGGLLCDTKFFNDGVQLLCKNNFNRMFQIKFDENLIFQKLNNQEQIILDVINYLKN